jgi:hypothetical protein
MNNKLERLWKETLMTLFKLLLRHFVEELRKIENLQLR